MNAVATSPTAHRRAAVSFHYVRLPVSLLTSAMHTPQAVGVYALIARVWGISKSAVPLSAGDLARYDPHLSRGAALRALNWLIEHGWLIAETSMGRKTVYTPSWGVIRGETRPWQVTAAGFGRPSHVKTCGIDARLLDLYIGRMTPYAGQEAACITRYLTAPALDLADVGSYALLLAGIPATTERLQQWHLACEQYALPLPSDAALFAMISQQSLFRADAPTLTVAGMERAGLSVMSNQSVVTQPLFFVPQSLIANLPTDPIGNLIDLATVTEPQSDPLPLQKVVHQATSSVDGWSNHPTEWKTNHSGRGATTQPMSLPETASAAILKEYLIAPENIRQLAALPTEVVQQTIAVASAESRIVHKRGWVVWALRAYRDHGYCPQVSAPQTTDWAAVARAFGDSAILGGTPATDLAGIGASTIPPVEVPCNQASQSDAAREDAMRQTLHHLFPPTKCTGMAGMVEHLQLCVKGATTCLVVQTVKQRADAEQQIVPVVRAVLREAGVCAPDVRVIVHAPPAAPESAEAARPTWLPEPLWNECPPLLRAALSGATYQDGTIQAASAGRQRQLDSRYHQEIVHLTERLMSWSAE